MLKYFGPEGSIARSAVNYEKRTLKRLLVYLIMILLLVAVFLRTLNDSIQVVDKLVLVDLINVEFEFASVGRSLYLGLFIHLSG